MLPSDGDICPGVLVSGKQITHIADHGYFFYFSLQSDHDIKSTIQVLVQTF